MILCDATIRKIPGSLWWRVFIEARWTRGSFESGCGPSYRGLIHRWAWRVWPLNIAVMRLR